MAVPANWSTVTVTGKFHGVGGTPRKGRVLFRCDVYLVNEDAKILVVPTVIVANLNAQGAFSATVPATNDPDITPSFQYTVVEQIEGVPQRSYPVTIPHDAVTADLTELVNTSHTVPAEQAVNLDLRYGRLDAANDWGASQTIQSSAAGGEQDTDSTSRLNLESYQKASLSKPFGEVLRIFARKENSKQMIAWYGPTEWDGNGDPVGEDESWFWAGAHYGATSGGDPHGHWSVEVPDRADGFMQTRMEFWIWDRNEDPPGFGMDKGVCRFHAVDVIMNANSNAHLTIGGTPENTNRHLYFASGRTGLIEDRRWDLRLTQGEETGSNAGSDFQIVRRTDSGTPTGNPPLRIRRSDGYVGINTTDQPEARLHVRHAAPGNVLKVENTDGTALAAYVVIEAPNDSRRVFAVQVDGDTVARLRILSSGALEWGPGGAGGADTNLYRNAANELRTDDDLLVGDGSVSRELRLVSSRDGGDDDGTGFDSTSRLNLESYQRAFSQSFGEVIRIFNRFHDAKSMITWYFPDGGYDQDGNPVGNFKPVVWTGAHWGANPPNPPHKHWSIETPDSENKLQTRFEIRFGDPSVDDAIGGLDKTMIATNLADFVVRCTNGQMLRLSANNDHHKAIEWSLDHEGATEFRRWVQRVIDTSGHMQFVRYDDSGVFQEVLLHLTRSTGRVGIGTTDPTTKLDLNSNKIRVRQSLTPASASAPGSQGDIAWDANFMYVCVATDTWKRVGIASW